MRRANPAAFLFTQMDFTTLISKVENLKIEQVVVKSIRETQFDIEELNREQLIEGLTSTGSPIENVHTGRTDYSPKYAEVRAREGLQVNHYDLKFRGIFQEKIEVMNVNAVTLTIADDDAKFEELVNLFGPTILGLNEQSRDKYKEVLEPVLIDNLKIELNL